MNKEAFPLHWPVGYKRTAYRIDSKFRKTMDSSQRFLKEELRRLGAKEIIVSTNMKLRNDGGVYSADIAKLHDDPGVAIYFKYKGQNVAMCCDRYRRVYENIYALGKGIEALRGMDWWGVSEFMDRAFTGFTAIDAPKEEEWYDILEVRSDTSEQTIKANYRRLCKDWHPDVRGAVGEDKIRKLNIAYEKAKQIKNFV